MEATMLALAFCVASGLCYAEAAIRQRRLSALRWGLLVRNSGWWVAIGLSALGGLLHVAALRFGPLALVQPLGALTLVFALPLGALRRERRTTAAEWLGAAVTAVALAGLVLLTAPAPVPPSLRTGQVLTVAGWSAAAVLALWAAARWVWRPVGRSIALAGAAAVAFGATSALVRVLTSLTGGAGTIAIEAVMIGLFMLAGVVLTQASYRDSGLGVPLAVQTVVNPAAATLIGISVLGEGYLGGGLGIVLAGATGLAMVAGVALLARGESARGTAGRIEGTSPRRPPNRERVAA